MIESSQDMTNEVEEDSAIKIDEFGVYYRKIEAPANYSKMMERFEKEDEPVYQRLLALGGIPVE